MDAEMLKIICDGYEKRLDDLELELQDERNSRQIAEKVIVCVSHGGHEFEKKGNPGCRFDECKFCGFIKDTE